MWSLIQVKAAYASQSTRQDRTDLINAVVTKGDDRKYHIGPCNAKYKDVFCCTRSLILGFDLVSDVRA